MFEPMKPVPPVTKQRMMDGADEEYLTLIAPSSISPIRLLHNHIQDPLLVLAVLERKGLLAVDDKTCVTID